MAMKPRPIELKLHVTAEEANCIGYEFASRFLKGKHAYSKKYLAQHEDDIIIHKAAKKAFDELGVKKIPTVKQLGVEFADVLREKKDAYAGA